MSCCETKVCNDCPVVEFTLTDLSAVVPSKGTTFSVGYDLTAISVYKKISQRTTLYNTGVKIVPPQGYYTEIVPRSSLSKTGYMLSNSVGIIDPDFSDNLLIALTKVDDSLPDIQLPFTRCQLILRKCEFFNMKEVSNITETGRGSFGSTDK
jgi:dUTP pyrophosphatase